MVRAFVTGGSGFLGRELIRALRASHYNVVALARSTDAARVITELGAQPVAGELPDQAPDPTVLNGIDVIFHLAAQVVEQGDDRRMFDINVRGTERMLSAARRAGVPRFVYVSTEAVLIGGRPIRDADENWPVPNAQHGAYARSKAEAERLVRRSSTNDFVTIVVRPRFLWGAHDTSVLPLFVDAARSGRLMWIGGGRYLTSTCHVRNACEGLIKASLTGRAGAVYFVTDGEPVEFRAFIERLLRTQGVEPPTRTIPRVVAHTIAIAGEAAWRALRLRGLPPITHAAYHIMGEQVTVRDQLARAELGYEGGVSREDGLREMDVVAAIPGSP